MISAVLITRNEEKNIETCLGSLAFCDEWIVVDSDSSDRTVDLAKKKGAKIFRRTFDDYASQKNYAISKASHEWLLLIDADECVPVDLAEEIQRTLKAPDTSGYEILRRNRIFGRWMNHGNHAMDYQLRLVRKEGAVFKGLVHERIVPTGTMRRLKRPLLHDSTRTVSAYMKKLNSYSSFEAQVLREKAPRFLGLRMVTQPLAVFFGTGVLKKGFWDGFEGFVFGCLSAYYDFLRYAKCWESQRVPRQR